MIQATELRIGNIAEWIRHDESFNQPVSIITIALTTIRIETGIKELGVTLVYDNELKPIPLTEEWLIKFGFEKKSEWFELKGFKVYWSDNNGSKSFYHINSDTVTYFDFVHILQNYYFFMTYLDTKGEELTIKE